MDVTIGEDGVRRVIAGVGDGELDPLAGGECSGCGVDLPVTDPAVVAAVATVEASLDWARWDVDQ